MPWSGGSFTRTNGVNTGATLWAQDRDDGTKILATRHDTNDQDMADGINSTLEKSGSNAATGNLNIGSNRLTAVADGTAKTDAATVNQIQSNGPAFQATDTGTANAYVIALSPAITAYAAGQEITFKAGAASTTASTLNVNTLGAKALKKLHDQDIGSGDIESGSIVTAVYDGTNFQVTSQLASSTITTPGGSNTQVQYNSSGSFAGSANFTFDGTSATVANPLFLPDGSASAPAISNTGDTNTGIAFIAADTVGVVTGGTEQFRFGSNPIPGGSKNFVYNGNANIAQRGTVSGLGGVNYVYGLDGWAAYGTSSSARYQMSQDTGPGAAYGAVSNNSVKIDITTADTASTATLVSAVIQKIEGQNLQQIRWGNAGALDLTLSFWVKSSKTGTHTVALWANDGNRGCPINYTVDSADTWQKISVTFPGDTGGTFPPDDNTAFLVIVFPIHTGSTYEGTNATWASGEKYATSSTVNLADSTSNNFWFTDVQLEVGSVATSFAYEDHGTTLARCQRYYTVWTGASTLGMSGVCRSTSAGALGGLYFPTEMRAAPTMAYTTVNCVDGSAGGVDGTLATSVAGTKSVTCTVGSASGFTDGNGLFVELKAGDGITASAEL